MMGFIAWISPLRLRVAIKHRVSTIWDGILLICTRISSTWLQRPRHIYWLENRKSPEYCLLFQCAIQLDPPPFMCPRDWIGCREVNKTEARAVLFLRKPKAISPWKDWISRTKWRSSGAQNKLCLIQKYSSWSCSGFWYLLPPLAQCPMAYRFLILCAPPCLLPPLPALSRPASAVYEDRPPPPCPVPVGRLVLCTPPSLPLYIYRPNRPAG